ncbi:MAG: glycogen synthase [Desulfocapsaceae bacterium]
MIEPEQQSITSVWMFSREYGRLAGAGGVKDVVSQLSKSLARWNNRRVSVVLPGYGFMDPEELGFSRLADPLDPDRLLEFDVIMDYTDLERRERVGVWYCVQDRVRVYLLEAQRFLEKQGVYTYTREEAQREPWKVQGQGHIDYFAMNVLLQKGGLDLIMLLNEKPQIIHCHDGHTAIVPAIIRECGGYRNYFRDSSSVVTIHNAGVGYHQEVSDLPFARAITGLPWQVINNSLLEHSFDPFLAAAPYAAITTVSENYAHELQQTDADYLTGWLGHRLLDDGVGIVGITNGIDREAFNPADYQKMGIAAGFQVDSRTDDLGGKLTCKKSLLSDVCQPADDKDEKRIGFVSLEPGRPLFTFIGRLSEQKGVDILVEALELFLDDKVEASVICLGSGSEGLEQALTAVARDPRYQGRLCFLRTYNTKLANQVYAAGDYFVIPSRYEPCGLTDYIAQLFGNLPIVHHIGGLVKVVDGVTGFAYRDNSPENLCEAMHHALATFEDKELIRKMQSAAVEKIAGKHTWKRVMQAYVQLYKKCRVDSKI